jgi:hypothetical protein
LLEKNIVVVVQIIDTDHLVASLKQLISHCIANKSGCTGNQNSHNDDD